MKGAAKTVKAKPATPVDAEAVIASLKRRGTKAARDGMARYGLPSANAFGISVGTLRQIAKELGTNHDLAAALWQSGWYEARMLAAFVDDPARVTPSQMDRWCRDFDNWGITDTVCFHLFDRTPYAWDKVEQWTCRKEEFVKRAGFALLASLVAHDKQASDARFRRGLSLIEREAADERNFVKKASNWALRCIGKRNPALNDAAVAVARRLADSQAAAARWVGKDALRELTSAPVARRLSIASKRRATRKTTVNA
jgi:3-methyladenine DNA glycosylase AlkD